MNNKKYTVFVSSTYEDLKDTRKSIINTLTQTDTFIPVAMETFGASPEDQDTFISTALDKSDFMVLIVGNKYGSLSPTGKSYTHNEFLIAKERNIPIFAYFIESAELDLRGSRGEVDNIDSLKNFLNEVKSNQTLGFPWKNENEISGSVISSLTNHYSKYSDKGWIKVSEIQKSQTSLENITQSLIKAKKNVNIITDEKDWVFKLIPTIIYLKNRNVTINIYFFPKSIDDLKSKSIYILSKLGCVIHYHNSLITSRPTFYGLIRDYDDKHNVEIISFGETNSIYTTKDDAEAILDKVIKVHKIARKTLKKHKSHIPKIKPLTKTQLKEYFEIIKKEVSQYSSCSNIKVDIKKVAINKTFPTQHQIIRYKYIQTELTFKYYKEVERTITKFEVLNIELSDHSKETPILYPFNPPVLEKLGDKYLIVDGHTRLFKFRELHKNDLSAEFYAIVVENCEETKNLEHYSWDNTEIVNTKTAYRKDGKKSARDVEGVTHRNSIPNLTKEINRFTKSILLPPTSYWQ
ncbi:MAG: DUF4062 domain-containing protein [Chitinophagales bacterium]